MLDCRTPEQWTEVHMAKEVYFEVAGDPHVAIDLLIRALKAHPIETLRAWLAEGHQHPGDVKPGPAPPKAEIPEWLKEKP